MVTSIVDKTRDCDKDCWKFCLSVGGQSRGRAIYTGRIARHQAKQSEEMRAAADALSLLANMSWPNRAETLLFTGDQNNAQNQRLACPTLGMLGKYRVPLSYVIATGGPGIVRYVLVELRMAQIDARPQD